MGKKKKGGGNNKKKKNSRPKTQVGDVSTSINFVAEAGPGCYIARRHPSPDWLIEWEDVDPTEFEQEEEEEVPDIAIDTEEQTLSVCNIDGDPKVAYVTVYDTRVLGANGVELRPGSTTDNEGRTQSCITFIVLCPP